MPSGNTLSKKEAKNQAAARRQELLGLLKDLGDKSYNDLNAGVFPQFMFPSRSVSNIVYDSKLKQYVLGKTNVKRSSGNIKHIRPFTQLLWLAFYADKLVNEKKTSTLREVYYSSQAYDMEFVDQAESDEIITDLEAVLSRPREQLKIYPEERSAIFGDLTVEYTVPGYEGQRLNLSSHPDGYQIGPSLSTAEFADTSADMIIVVEKGGIFTRFVEEKVHKRYKAILVDTGGQAPRSTRYLIRRLNKELNLPVYVMTDGDVYGEHIAMVIISGSAGAAHLRDLTVPTAKWVGVWASDVVKYKLPTDPMTEADVKRAQELKKDPRYSGGLWQRELDIFLKIKRKSELEAFSKYGLTFIVDNYLKEKMQEAKSL